MHNTDLITKNEVLNDGSRIHLYLIKDLDAWIAFGLSAYSLRLFAKHSGWKNCLRSYSAQMQMPYTVVDAQSARLLLSSLPQEEQVSDDYIYVRTTAPVDKDAYAKWTRKLHGIPAMDDDMSVETPVSQFVPKDRFIPDNMSSFSRNLKRLCDCFLALIALVVFSPLFLVIWIAVRCEDGGPVIYSQERIGRFGRAFNIYKFRSMRLDAEKSGPALSASGGEGDTRLTKVGRFIRAHHLDELPQLWNVFCGDMSFIGPRPERKFYIDQIMEYDPRYTYLYQIRPGVTSYATLYNGYTDTMEKMLRRLEYDLYYLGHRSFLLDFKILARTFFSIVFGKKF